MKCGICGDSERDEYKEVTVSPKNFLTKLLTFGRYVC